MESSANSGDKASQLKRVRSWRKRVASAEAALLVARAGRDDAIRDAVRAGASEREAADGAGVSPAHAHAAAKNGRHVAAARRLSKKK